MAVLGLVAAAVAAGAATAAYSAHESRKAAKEQNEQLEQMSSLLNKAQPSENTAKDNAADILKKKRTTLLRTGGMTDITAGEASLAGSDVKHGSLLG